MNKQEQLDGYVAYLRQEGYLPEIKEGGYISFKKEGDTYVIIPHEADETYFQLSYPNFWSIESAEERIRVLEACNSSMQTTKGVKFILTGDDTWALVEVFLPTFESFKAVFARSVSSIKVGVDRVVNAMREKQAADNPTVSGKTEHSEPASA